MLTLQGFIFTEQLHVGEDSLVYCGTREADGRPVIAKLLKEAHPTKEQKARFTREYEILSQLPEICTVVSLGLRPFRDSLLFVMEMFGTHTLQQLIEQSPLSLSDALTILIKIIDSLEIIHSQHIIHKDLNPQNILWDAATQQIRIIDFGISCTLRREELEIQNVQAAEGMLPYMSPEQTGRMNRGMDYRSDYYSLGVVLYQMLTGQLPFRANDALGWIHCHIAVAPPNPSSINAAIPDMVSAIVLKLMAKNAEERYQSLYGLKADLRRCLDYLALGKEIPAFPIGGEDISPRFSIPEKLYGREAEVHELLTTFDRASEGRAELMLVAGYSGVGKSRLIREVRKPITARRGYFISGKFDQFGRNIPYASLIQAFTLLVQQILTESEARVQAWKTAILAALGPNGRVMLDLVPSLVNIIGEQPPVPQLEGKEAQNRFNYVLQRFFSALATKEHPLAIFLDDLQWVDTSSLELLQLLLTSDESRYFLIIGAYRNNEIDDLHPLTLSLEFLRKNAALVNKLTLLPLNIQHVTQLLADTLKQNVTAVSELASICMEKTQGNPFFLSQFLLRLYQEELIEFNHQQGRWYWKIEQVRQKSYTDNVVEFMSLRIHELPNNAQKVLRLAACLGNRFELSFLAIIAEQTPRLTAEHLWPTLQQEFIVPMDERYKYAPYIEGESELIVYQFLHDQIQQAAYRLFSEEELPAVHLKIGRLLLQHIAAESLPEIVLELVNHLNRGISLITDPEEIEKLAQLNLMAGGRAKNNISYDLALHYFKTGISLLTSQAWENQYKLTLKLYTESAEAAFLAAQFAELDFFANEVLQHAKSPIDNTKVYLIKIQNFTFKNDLTQAIRTGLEALALLDIHISETPTTLQVLSALMKTNFRLMQKSWNTLYHLPRMTDPGAQAAMKILHALCSSAYIYNPNLLVLITGELIRLTLKYGLIPASLFAFLGYATILIGKFNRIKQGYSYGELSLYLFDQLSPLEQQPRWIMPAYFLIVHWKIHLSKIEVILSDFQKCLNMGDPEYAGYIAYFYSTAILFGGKKLELVADSSEKHVRILEKSSELTGRQYVIFIWLIALRLRGFSEQEIRKKMTHFDESAMIAELTARNDHAAMSLAYFTKLYVNYILGNYKEAYPHVEQTVFLADLLLGSSIVLPSYFYSALTCLSYHEQATGPERRAIKKYVRKIHKRIRLWSRYAPMNSLHKYYLLLAEEARVKGRIRRAKKYYDLAISLAHENKYFQEEALANELAAYFYLTLKQEKLAQLYLQDAYAGYSHWGAFAKLRQLEEKYSEFLTQESVVSQTDLNLEKNLYEKTYTTSTSIVEKGTSALDMATLMKIAQTISKEVLLTDLLRNMLTHVMENAGAKKSCILLETNDQWFVEASVTFGEEPIILKSLPLAEHVPISVVEYVIRSHEWFVSNNALLGESFADDPYIKSAQPKSLLCLPLLSHGNLKGILYLENNVNTHVFNRHRLDLMKLLSGQIVISIENAKFYERLVALSLANARFVPTEFLNSLGKHEILDVRLGDHIQKDMSVLFLGIRDFSTFSEEMSPQENFRFINGFLSYMVPIITAHEGFVDKYLGDGIMALFPDSSDAVHAGIDMLRALVKFNAIRAEVKRDPIHVGIGLNTGLLMLGIVGEEYHIEGTVISDVVNLASRVQDLSKLYHVPLLITEAIYARLKEKKQYAIRKLGLVQIRGKILETLLYEVFDADPPHLQTLKLQTQVVFERGIQLYHDKAFQEAKTAFQEVLQINPEDEAARIYQQWCQKS